MLRLPITCCFVLMISLLAFTGFNTFAASLKSTTPFPQGLELHSDDNNITRHVNISSPPVSAAVDTIKLIFQRLAWDVTLLNVPLIRSLSYMDAGKAVCIVNKIKTSERDKQYLFSQPMNFFESQRLYQLTELPPIPEEFLDEQGAVKSIHAVINSQPESTILTPMDFSFGERIDNDLKQTNQHQNITITNEAYYSSYLKMFAFKRTDYAIAFPLVLYRNYSEENSLDVRSYPIADNPKFIAGRFWCSDTPETRRFIAITNKVVKTLYADPEFIKAHTRYLPEQSANAITNVIAQYASAEVVEDDNLLY